MYVRHEIIPSNFGSVFKFTTNVVPRIVLNFLFLK